ncbi:MAG: PEP-CTERM sorting domain-containing protein [Phenylobacterium sp.]|nr:PEP-CTERM sorting domain-containing protein [Phenylobacterium sp.]
MRKRHLVASLGVALGLTAPSSALALAILDIPGLQKVSIYETTGGAMEFAFLPTDPRLLTRRDALNFNLKDFGIHGQEHYDVFLSDENGQAMDRGSYVTIEGVCAAPGAGCFNIAAVAYWTSSGPVAADILANAVYGRANSFIPGSAGNAVDGFTLGTHTTLGDTAGLPASYRMSVTVGFTGISNPTAAIPEPSGWAVMLLGFGGLGAALRQRRRQQAPVALSGPADRAAQTREISPRHPN